MGEIALTAGLWPGGIRIQEDTWPVLRLREGIERLVALVRVRSLTHRFVALTSAWSTRRRNSNGHGGHGGLSRR